MPLAWTVRESSGTCQSAAVDAAAITRAFEDAFDEAIVFHGYTDYMRDYEVIVCTSTAPGSGFEPQNLRYLFTHCVMATVTTALTPSMWAASLDERLVDYDKGVDLDGYVWGVKWQTLYPGAELVPDSPEAARWQDALGIQFHEAVFGTNGHTIRLVFSDLRVTEVPFGWTPFVLTED